jgi:hypothetical protein
LDSIEEEDLGPEVAALLKGYRFVCQINIEGDFEAGYAAAFDDVERAVEAGGALVDQQQGTLRTRRKIEPLRQVKRGKPVAPPGTLSFWFESDPANQDQLFDAFVDLMAEKLPEALPRRYGPYEPAQFSWEEHGPEHFKMLWKAEGRNAGGFVWLGSPPVKHVFTSIRNDPISFPKGPPIRGRFVTEYRCSSIQLSGSARLVLDRGIALRAQDFMRDAALLLGSFYAELRLGEPVIQAWWWKGLPSDPALAFVLGEPYRELWPSAASIGQQLSKQIVLLDLETQTRHRLVPPPELIAPEGMLEDWHLQLNRTAQLGYAPVFPFELPAPSASEE